MHKTIEPTILYFGTPVALISTLNADGSANLAPMSSAWWLGWSCMLGLGQMGQTSDNLIRTRECVINLPSQDQSRTSTGSRSPLARIPCRRKSFSGAIGTSRTNSASPGSLR
jgi:flavin reductase (DIM6/NTAB) family NADH-FMN oxidoreductase RutF